MDNDSAYIIEDSFYKPETRWDFYVSEKRKRVWAKELEIVFEFDRICKKHGLRYTLDGGTLLGAIRHQGFIPWDDDFDVNMPRADYERAREIMQAELPYPFEWQDLYTNLSVCTPEQITSTHMLPFAKIRNRETTAIEPPAMPQEINQGIWIDIFPLDDGFDEDNITPEILEMEKELYVTVFGKSEIVQKLMAPGTVPAIPKDNLEEIFNLPVIERYRIFEQTLASMEGVSTQYTYLYLDVLHNNHHSFDKSYYEDIIYVPFEGFEMPVIKEYHTFMTWWFGGDYMKPFIRKQHSAIFNPDVSYMDYFLHPDRYIDTLQLGCDD